MEKKRTQASLSENNPILSRVELFWRRFFVVSRRLDMSWVDRGRDAGRFFKEIEVKDLQEQVDAVRDFLRDLTASFSKIANRQA